MAAAKDAASDKVMVVMRPHAHGFEPGQRIYVDQETADFLVAAKHADLPLSKRQP